jgi:hypothetical protein
MLETMDPADWIGDKGYIGNGMITPIRKPPGRKLLDWEKEFNKQVNKIRYRVEQAIANFKTWRIMHVDYRDPSTPAHKPFPRSSACTSINWPVNKPLALGSAER